VALRDRYCGASECRLLGQERKCLVPARSDATGLRQRAAEEHGRSFRRQEPARAGRELIGAVESWRQSLSPRPTLEFAGLRWPTWRTLDPSSSPSAIPLANLILRHTRSVRISPLIGHSRYDLSTPRDDAGDDILLWRPEFSEALYLCSKVRF
jgi:hypothetical protein